MTTKTEVDSIVITGASTGIGKACALHLAQRGWQVFAGVRNQADADALQHEAAGRLTPVFIDVTDEEGIVRAAEVVGAAVGARGLAGLVNNAGVAVSGPTEFVSLPAIRRQFEVNVFGQIAVTQAFLPLLRKRQGRIVNMSSVSGRVVYPLFGPYAASKHALEAFSDALRRELSPWGLHVAVVEPASVATPIWEKARLSADKELAALPPQAMDLYGTRIRRVYAMAGRQGERGMPPAVVVGAVTHALTSKRPKTRYFLANGPFSYGWAFRLLPDRVLDYFITRFTR